MSLKDTSQNMAQIVAGYRKLKTKDKSVIQMSQRRMRHCMSCILLKDSQNCNPNKKAPHIKTGNVVAGCGCYMPSKTKLQKAKCPLGKW